MPVNAITSAAVGNYVEKVTSSVPAQSGISTPMQEAQETPQVTAKEAARGDRQAKALLAAQQQRAQQNAPAKVPGQGRMTDHLA